MGIDRQKKTHSYACSGIGFRLEEDDLNWIFFNYAAVNCGNQTDLSDLRNGKRNIYILKSISKSAKDICEYRERKALSFFDDGYADPDLYTQELLGLLSENNKRDTTIEHIFGKAGIPVSSVNGHEF